MKQEGHREVSHCLLRHLLMQQFEFVDSLVSGGTGPSCRMADANSGSPASPAYTGVSSGLIRNETRRSVDAGSPEKVAVGMIRPLLTHFLGVVKKVGTC